MSELCKPGTRVTDITIVGLGVLNIDQITPQTEHAIGQCNEVLYVDTGAATRAWLESRCPRVNSLFETSYRETDRRLNAYHHMAACVIDAAMDHAPVVFAMHRHPTVGAYAPFLIRDMAEVLDLTVRVLPGISAMDCLLAELMVDPCVAGVQMYEATDLLLRRRPLESDVPALIWQIGTVETSLHTMHVSKPQRFERLRSHLLRFYPPEHEATAFFSTPHPLMQSTQLHFALRDLCEQAPHLHAGFTLFIPAATERPIEDHELLKLIDSPQHLHQITRQAAGDAAPPGGPSSR